MLKLTIFLCVFALLSWSAAAGFALVPPKGYSVGFTGVVKKGLQKYVCGSGAWSKTVSSADVFAPNGAKLARYWTLYNSQTRISTYFWYISNTAGGYQEGGDAVIVILGKAFRSVQVRTSSMSEYLARVSFHSGVGEAEQVAFVSLTGTTGGLSPKRGLCTSDGATTEVPFTGKFTFYTQDLQPPQVPASITPSGNFVQTVFLGGNVVYRFSRGNWDYRGTYGNMADVSGGRLLGICSPAGVGNVQFQFFKSEGFSGFSIVGYVSKVLKMSNEGCAWQLLKITSHIGQESPFGKYTSVLFGATLGGLPPTVPSTAEETQYGSPFTAQLYLYA